MFKGVIMKVKQNGYIVKVIKKDMINVTSNLCKTYLCYTRVSEKYEGYCLYCFINMFPEKPVS